MKHFLAFLYEMKRLIRDNHQHGRVLQNLILSNVHFPRDQIPLLFDIYQNEYSPLSSPNSVEKNEIQLDLTGNNFLDDHYEKIEKIIT